MLIHNLFFKVIPFLGIMVIIASLYDLIWIRYFYGKKHIKNSFFLLAILANSIAFGLLTLLYELKLIPVRLASVYLLVLIIKVAVYGRKFSNVFYQPNISFPTIVYPLIANTTVGVTMLILLQIPLIVTVITAALLLQVPYFSLF